VAGEQGACVQRTRRLLEHAPSKARTLRTLLASSRRLLHSASAAAGAQRGCADSRSTPTNSTNGQRALCEGNKQQVRCAPVHSHPIPRTIAGGAAHGLHVQVLKKSVVLLLFLPHAPMTLMDWGVSPTCPITATPASTMACAASTRAGLPPGVCVCVCLCVCVCEGGRVL